MVGIDFKKSRVIQQMETIVFNIGKNQVKDSFVPIAVDIEFGSEARAQRREER